jgi:large subunit ribosomal protein L6
MSRIGKKAVEVPSGVQVTLAGQTLTVKGPKGQLSQAIPEEITIAHADGQITFTPANDTQRARSMWGLSRTLTANMVEGVTKGFERRLELVGVGYRAAMKGQNLSLALGYSHDVDMPPPAGVSFAVPRPVEVVITGIDKQVVGETAARIRKVRPPEPYKGKGVRYAGEKVRRKEGKKK